ncbi:hypothetical protein FB451DRAFT_1569312 [Mycena latifolia]|nr:hypothetical protein FB451DRAFT_1569312 [Mycena latifolia]
MDQTFNASTGGILPAALEPVDASAWFSGTDMNIIPPSASMASASKLVGLSTDYSMVTFLRLLTNCPVKRSYVNDTYMTLSPELSYLALLTCTPGDNNYTLIIVGNGAYDSLPTSVCTMVPQVTNVSVDYGATINAAPPTHSVPQDVNGPAPVSAIYTLWNVLSASQALDTNAVGTQWASLNSKLNWHDEKRGKEQYFRGVTEYSASTLRACLSVKKGAFVDGFPNNMSIPTHGTTATQARPDPRWQCFDPTQAWAFKPDPTRRTLHGTFRTETLGWTYASTTTQWILLPGTFIAIATIVMVLVALHRHPGDIHSGDSGPLDLSNPLHLIAAAAAGRLENTFRGANEEEREVTQGLVKLTRG